MPYDKQKVIDLALSQVGYCERGAMTTFIIGNFPGVTVSACCAAVNIDYAADVL